MTGDPGLLVIDGDRELREALKDTLDRKGYRAESASTSQGALGKRETGSFDVAMLDNRFSDTDDAELLRTMKARWPNTTVIVVKENDCLDGTVNTLEGGVFAYINKPLVIKEVIARIDEALEKQRSVRENRRMFVDMAAINAITTMFNHSIHPDEILDRAMDEVLKLTNMERGGIFLLDEEGQLNCQAARGLERWLIAKLTHHEEDGGVARKAIESCQPLILESVSLDPETKGLGLGNAVKESGALIPICYRGRALGLIGILSSHPLRFCPEDVNLLMTIGEQLGFAIENARLYKEASNVTDRIKVIGDIITAVHSTIDLRQVFSEVAGGIRKLVDFDRATISLLEELEGGGARVRVFALAATSATELKVGDTSDVKDSVTDWLVNNRNPLIMGESETDQGFLSGKLFLREDLRSAMVIPLFSEDAVVGSLNLSSGKPNNYCDKDLEILKPVAEQIAIAIQKWRFYEELKTQTSEIATAYEQLKVAQESLIRSEKLRALGELASGVAHDVNNHLAAIVLHTQLLSKQVRSETVQQTIETIKQVTMDCAHTVSRIQEFAGLRASKAFVAVDINQIVEDVITVTKPKWRDEAQQKGKEITISTRLGDIALIAGSPEDIRQALMNIVINAIDAMSNGGKITLITRMEEDWVYISVKDTGVGMTEEVKQRVFEAFFSTKGSKGNGLGLRIARGIITQHGGEILVDTEEEEGSTFTIKLPVRLSVPGEQLVSLGKTKKANILIIEDEESIRGALSQILTEEGHSVTVAKNGPEGIARYKQDTYDMVLTDLGMPWMSGWEVVKAIKGMDSQSVVVLMTGWGDQLDQAKMRDLGVDLVLAKPFDSDQVLRLIEKVQEIKIDPLTSL